MTTLTPTSPLDISRNLSEHSEGERIHKLLYWTVKGRWESTSAVLNRAPIQGLIQDLLNSSSALTDLEYRLTQAAAQLSKPEKYRQIVSLVVRNCQSYYQSTSAKPNLNAEIQMPAPSCEAEEDGTTPITAVSKLDRFEVRQFLMQQIPPLKAKILIFSLLRRPFTNQPLDWTELRAKSLDGWMAELVQTFPLPPERDAKLIAQATQITVLDQGLQVAEAVIQSARLRFS